MENITEDIVTDRVSKHLESSWILKLIQGLASPWKIQLVVEIPWISLLTLSNPKGKEQTQKDLQDKIAHVVE